MVKNDMTDIGGSPYVRMRMSIGYLEHLVNAKKRNSKNKIAN